MGPEVFSLLFSWVHSVECFFYSGQHCPKDSPPSGIRGQLLSSRVTASSGERRARSFTSNFFWGVEMLCPILKKAPWRHSPFKQQQIDDKHRIISTTNLVVASLTRHSPKSLTYIRVFAIPIFSNSILNNFPGHYSKGSTTEKRNEQPAASLTTLSQATRHLQVPVSQTARQSAS